MREQKGITLIALVITIIVLLILAGVTIAMLTGQNGILTNSNKANCENAYYQAKEQIGLAYMAVRTQIMSETVKSSTYDATEVKSATDTTPAVNNPETLRKIVDDDLGTEFSVVLKNGDNTHIYIRYTNNAIDQGLISGTSASDYVPKNDTYVYAQINLENQSASFGTADYDITQPSGVNF